MYNFYNLKLFMIHQLLFRPLFHFSREFLKFPENSRFQKFPEISRFSRFSRLVDTMLSIESLKARGSKGFMALSINEPFDLCFDLHFLWKQQLWLDKTNHVIYSIMQVLFDEVFHKFIHRRERSACESFCCVLTSTTVIWRVRAVQPRCASLTPRCASRWKLVFLH